MLKHTLLLPLFFCALISQAQTVADIIIASENHTTLEAAVTTAELVETLQGDGPYTVFAPTDSAFTVLLNALEIDADSLLSFPNLGDILLYHVLGDSVQSGDLLPTQMVTMANMDEATITSDSTGVMINGVAMVTVANTTATNGVVHVIDAVLLPPADEEEESLTIAGIIDTSSAHTDLSGLLALTGLDETLSGDGPYTVFAPTNDAFTALGAATLLELTTEPEFVQLTSILTYHVAEGTAMSGDLSDGQLITTVNGADVTISIDTTGTVMVNGVATVVIADVEASNGVIHVIDAVLTPAAPETNTVVDIIVNSEDHNLLEQAVVAAGLVDALSAPGPFTVFAPNDAAIVALVTELGISAPDLLADEALADILKYHVVDGSTLSSALIDGQMITTLQGGDVEISIDACMTVMVNDATVIDADIPADNGVVHVIDKVLMPGPTGVASVSLESLFEVYPNPTTDAIRWNGAQVDRLQVVDTEGRVRMETTNPGNMVDLSGLEAGLFFVVIEAEGERLVKTVLKH